MALGVFTEDEKVRIRHHLGYLQVAEAYTLAQGVPAAVQTQFMIEGAVVRVRAEAMALARQILCRLDELNADFFCGAKDFASMKKVDTVEFNEQRRKELAAYYRAAQQELANFLGVVVNPFDQREIVMAGGSAMLNAPVVG